MAGVGDVPAYDQRGFAFTRVVGGRIDVGAFEAGAVSADFDVDGDVDGRDFLLWQRGFGTAAPNAVNADGDADNDTDVDGDDLGVWQDQYGEEELSAVSSQLSAEDNLIAENHASAFWIAAPNTREAAASERVTLIDEKAVEEVAVDRAFADLALRSGSAIQSFGELVVRRGMPKRMALELFESVL